MRLLKILSLSLLITSNLFAFDDLRNLETIVIPGGRIQQFVDSKTNVGDIFVYRFHRSSQMWEQISWQLDEKTSDNSYFGKKDSILQKLEEISFMAKDAGDWASPIYWIDNDDSKNYQRYEIRINDPYNSADDQYVYIYKSLTLKRDPSLPEYVVYTPSSSGKDKITATSYSEEHVSGIPQLWKIPESVGGQNIDILDRQKARVKGKYSFPIGEYNLTEKDGLEYDNVNTRTGPIRMIRRVNFNLKYSGLKLGEISMTKIYYPNYIVSTANKKLKTDYGVTMIRLSYDLNDNGYGMRFLNPYNDLEIDGVLDDYIDFLNLAPEWNWYMVTGDPGSVVALFQVDAIGNQQYLYYCDKRSESSCDGTPNTGIKGNCGDVGVTWKGSKLEGRLGMPMRFYFLGANQEKSVAETVFDYFNNPLLAHILTNGYVSQIALHIPDYSQEENLEVSIPVYIQDVTGLDITSLQLQLGYDPDVLEPVGIDNNNTLTAGWAESTFEQSAGQVNIRLSGETALTGEGVLIWVRFKTIGSANNTSVIAFNNVVINDNAVNAATQDGLFTVLRSTRVAVSLPSITGQEQGIVQFPITISNITGLDVKGIHLKIDYNTSILNAIDVTKTGTIAESWEDLTWFENENGIDLDFSGNNSITGEGELLNLSFHVIGEQHETDSLVIREILFEPESITGIPQNGYIEVQPATITISLPDTIYASGTTIQVPVIISDVTGLDITSITLGIAFDYRVLEATGISSENCLVDSWEDVSSYLLGSRIRITLNGSAPLIGSGTLIYINFNVVGADQASSTLNVTYHSIEDEVNLNITNGSLTISGVVPVELTSFNCDYIDGIAELHWITTSESNNYGFEIQRREKDQTEWEIIDFIRGHGTTTSIHEYSYSDEDVIYGTIQYRLKQIDYNGQFKFSEIIEIKLEMPKVFSLNQNYPNPFNSITKIKYQIPGNVTIKLRIFNLLGEEVITLINGYHSPGIYSTEWKGEDEFGNHVPSGVYIYQLKAGSTVISKKMILLE